MSSFLKGMLPGAIVFIALIIYQLGYALLFFPITEGWFASYAWLLRMGYLPYRDFSLLLPPLYSIQLALVQIVFGDDFFALRILGILITGAIGLVLWGILRRFFSSWISAYAATISIIYYQCGNAFIGYDFTQVLTLYILLGTLFLLLQLEASKAKSNRQSTIFIICAGFFLCAALLTKQSNGGIGAFIIFLGYLLATLKLFGLRFCLSSSGKFIFGAAILLFPILLWLYLNNALPYFLDQVIFDAIRAKGGGQKIYAWISGFFLDPSYQARTELVAKYLMQAFFLCFAPAYLLSLLGSKKYFPNLKKWLPKYLPNLDSYDSRWVNSFTIAIFLMGIFTAFNTSSITSPSSQNAHEFTLRFLFQTFIICIWCIIPSATLIFLDRTLPLNAKNNFFTFHHSSKGLMEFVISSFAFITLFIFLFGFWKGSSFINPRWVGDGNLIYSFAITFSTHLYIIGSIIVVGIIFSRASLFKAKITVLFFLGLGLIIGSGTSAGLSEISAFLGVALLTAFLMQITVVTPLSSLVPIIGSALLCLYLFNIKLESPYSWWAVKADSVRKISCAESTGILKKICINPRKYEKLMDIVSQIRDNSIDGDRLYVFPHMPIFNLLSNRLPFGNAVVSWFDFTSQSLLNALIRDLNSNPPKVLLIARLPNEVFEGHERLFNKSIPSKQREIISIIDSLSHRNIIKLIKKVNIDNIEIELYVKN